jgi:hypothetical protein
MDIPVSERTDSDRLTCVLQALAARDAHAATDRMNRTDTELARTDIEAALDRIATLLPMIDVDDARWRGIDALAGRLVLEEIARAVDRLRFLSTQARTHLESAARSLKTVERGRRKLAERW